MDALDEQYRKGMTAVICFSMLNNIASMTVVFFVMTQKHTRHSVVARLIWNLSLSDFIQSTGFILSSYWMHINGIKSGIACDIQGFLINLGDIASSFWVFVICLHTYMLVVYSLEYPHVILPGMIIIWPLSMLLSGLGFFIQKPSIPFFTSAGGLWCWISSDYSIYRIGFHYGIILSVAFSIIVLYAIMFSVLYKRQKRMSDHDESKRILQSVSKKLIWYPLVYFFIVLPLAILRITSMFGENLPFGYLVFAACTFTCAGLANAIIYGVTRNVVSVKPFVEIVRRMTLLHEGPHNLEVDPGTSNISVTTTQEIKVSYIEPFSALSDEQSCNSDFSQESSSSST